MTGLDRKPPPPAYRAVFETAAHLLLILTPDLRISAASNDYLAATMTDRDTIVGRNVFDVFPENAATASASGAGTLAESFAIVLRTRKPHTMALLKYDIRKPEEAGGGFEERFWLVVNSPGFDEAGELAFIVNRVEDVTQRVRLEQERDRILTSLRQALDEVKQLTGLIPICSWCKKVRDDQGAWQKLEKFLSDRTDATFTHGMCADCARAMVPPTAP